ncbi:MAG: PBP1A family penicillin-binding protein [Thermoleophilia bacterium]
MTLALAPLFLSMLALGSLSLGLRMAAAVVGDVPRLENQRPVELAETSRIYAADGSLLAYLHGVENRELVGGERIPQQMKDALVAIEDERFYEHEGVDLQGVLRALVVNIQAKGIEEGGSTITQQLVSMLYLDPTDQSLEGKINEWALAWQLEERMSKDEILDLYLNTVYFGSNAYGIQAASRTYFDKYPQDLDLPEAALLAGLPQAPSRYSPRVNPEAAKARRNEVLQRMWINGYITLAEYKDAIAAPIELAPESPYRELHEPYVVDYVKKQLIDMFGVDRVFEGGLVVMTSINPAYQRHAEEAIRTTLDRPGDPSSALVAIDVRTGQIRAMVGSQDYDTSKFNLAAQGRRQAGSAFKTFALVAAVEMGMNPYTTTYVSKPLSISLPGWTKPWRVRTFSNSYSGAITLQQATLRSDNSVYAQLALDVTPERIVDAAHRMGITSDIQPFPAIVLGGLTHGVSPLEMASAYGTLGNMGSHVEPHVILSVRDSRGNLIYEADPKQTQAVSQGVAAVVNDILQANIQRGTGTRARIGRPAAGKTGTAQNFQDAWFCGYTPQISTAVWVGHPEAQIEMRNVHGIRVTGGSFPAMIWGKFMQTIMVDYPVESFPRPDRPASFREIDTRHEESTRGDVSDLTSTTTTSEADPSTTLAPPITIPSTTLAPPITQPSTTQPPTTQPPSTQPPTTQSPPATNPPPTTAPAN